MAFTVLRRRPHLDHTSLAISFLVLFCVLSTYNHYHIIYHIIYHITIISLSYHIIYHIISYRFIHLQSLSYHISYHIVLSTYNHYHIIYHIDILSSIVVFNVVKVICKVCSIFSFIIFRTKYKSVLIKCLRNIGHIECNSKYFEIMQNS